METEKKGLKYRCYKINNENMINQFNDIVDNAELKSKLKLGVELFYDEKYPYTSYFGLNYSKNKIESIKFYFITFKKIPIEKLKKFFPPIEGVNHIYKDFIESFDFSKENIRNMGVTFSIKINSKKEISYSFYQQHKNFVISPQKLNLPEHEAQLRNNFYVKEFNKDSEYEKNYYLIMNKKNIDFLLDFFNVKYISSEHIQGIEYAEFEDSKKMVLVIPNNESKTVFINNNNDLNFKKLKEDIEKRYDLVSEFPGLYHKSDKKTVYFFDKENQGDFFKKSLTINKMI